MVTPSAWLFGVPMHFNTGDLSFKRLVYQRLFHPTFLSKVLFLSPVLLRTSRQELQAALDLEDLILDTQQQRSRLVLSLMSNGGSRLDRTRRIWARSEAMGIQIPHDLEGRLPQGLSFFWLGVGKSHVNLRPYLD